MQGEDFVPAERRSIAYMDGDILGHRRDRTAGYLMEPMVFARLNQLAEIAHSDRVLHIGCTTGYGTAVIARLAAMVVAIDENEALVDLAAATLRRQRRGQCRGPCWPPCRRRPESNGPYDAIVLDGRVPVVGEPLLGQLKEGGRLVAVVGSDEAARAMLFRRNGSFSSLAAFDASVQQLPGILAPSHGFVF